MMQFLANPEFQDSLNILVSPSYLHWFGTDELGRDLFSRVIYGIRLSLLISIVATLFSVIFGWIYGTLAFMGSSFVNHFMTRVIDIFYSVPDLLVFILLGIFLGRDEWGMILALSLFSWMDVARITRSVGMGFRESPHHESLKSLGAGVGRTYFFHGASYALSPVVTSAFLKMPLLVIAESTLSFLGLGLKAPRASLGSLVAEGFSAFQFYPHLIVFPLGALVILVLLLNSFRSVFQKHHNLWVRNFGK